MAELAGLGMSNAPMVINSRIVGLIQKPFRNALVGHFRRRSLASADQQVAVKGALGFVANRAMPWDDNHAVHSAMPPDTSIL